MSVLRFCHTRFYLFLLQQELLFSQNFLLNFYQKGIIPFFSKVYFYLFRSCFLSIIFPKQICLMFLSVIPMQKITYRYFQKMQSWLFLETRRYLTYGTYIMWKIFGRMFYCTVLVDRQL